MPVRRRGIRFPVFPIRLTTVTKDTTLNPSLSVILPVCNAESKLAPVVHQLLEVTSELTATLELMIVDDGSTDNTEEVAMELCRQYPQVKTLRYAKQAGHVVAVRAGIMDTTGDVVLIQTMDAPISGEAIRDLWEMRNDEKLVFDRPDSAHSDSLPKMYGRPTWSGGTQMLRREAISLECKSAEGPGHDGHQAKQSSTVSIPPATSPIVRRVTRTDSRAKSSVPTLFHLQQNVEMQADR